MDSLEFVVGDATAPVGDGNRLIAHICNDIGGWGKGFVLAISARWPDPERDYRRWHLEREQNDFALGALRLVQVSSDTWVANMVAQHGVRASSDGPPIRYDALGACLETLGGHATRAPRLRSHAAHRVRSRGREVGTDRATGSRVALRPRRPGAGV